MNSSVDGMGKSEILKNMINWDITDIFLYPGGSNYVFLVKMTSSGNELCRQEPPPFIYGIYKPVSGERPLRDFPTGTLHLRERAAYIVSEILGWPRIPPTVVRDGPYGSGSVQFYIVSDKKDNFFTLRDKCLNLFLPIAMFDVLVFNADRKGGSCLKSLIDGNLWAIDHGLTFNPKACLRTVMLEFNGLPYPPELKVGLVKLMRTLSSNKCQNSELSELLSLQELDYLGTRAEQMLENGSFPILDPRLNVPWPFL